MLDDSFSRIGRPRLLVIGDLILDRYTFGNAERVSPEAPVLVLRVDGEEVRLGGAASVAMLLRGLDAEVTLAGVVGDDSEGRTLLALVRDERIDGDLIVVDPGRPTTSKNRIIGRAAGRHAHQIVRVDHELRTSVPDALVGELSDRIAARMAEFTAVLISDYSKGVCTPEFLQRVIESARRLGLPVIVDPARIADYSRYAGATLLKPNRTEAELASGQRIDSPAAARLVAQALCQQQGFQSVLVTLDSDGMVLVEHDARADHQLSEPPADGWAVSPALGPEPWHFPTVPRAVYDITGAGDMVLAALGLCIASQMPLATSVQVANVAAGLEVERFGVSPISRSELQAALASTNPTAAPENASGLALAKLLPVLDSYRSQGKTIVFTNGCFDLLHVGHVTTLSQAAALGDVLVVGINSDSSVRRLKGPTRPVIPEDQRAQMVAALVGVAHVVVFDDATPLRLLSAIRPDVLVKGGTTGEIVGREIVEAYGGRVIRVDAVPGVSTTALIASIDPQFSAKHPADQRAERESDVQLRPDSTSTITDLEPSADRGTAALETSYESRSSELESSDPVGSANLLWPQPVTPCRCVSAGFCSRHQCEKSHDWMLLCRLNWQMFDAWERGEGPCVGQLRAEHAEHLAATPAFAALPVCRHRELEPLELVDCELCGGRRESVPVYGCALYGRCTQHRYGTRTEAMRTTATCAGCDRYQPQDSAGADAFTDHSSLLPDVPHR